MRTLTEVFLEKSRRGTYKDNPENRRLHRVGMPYDYGKKAKEKGADAKRNLRIRKQVKAKYDRFVSEGVNFNEIDSGFFASEDRTRKIEELKEKVVFSKVVPVTGRKPKAIFTMGGAASGKSSSLRKLGYDPDSLPTVNPDDFKENVESPLYESSQLFEFNDFKSGAGKVHEESSKIAKEVFRDILTMGGDFIKDGVMGNFDKSIRDLQAVIDAGFEPEIVAVSLPTGKAIERNKSRYNGMIAEKGDLGGRYVGNDKVIDGHIKAVETFVKIVNSGFPVSIKLFDNDVPRGTEPKLVYDSSKRPPILNKKAVQEWLAKAGLTLNQLNTDKMKRKEETVMKSLGFEPGHSLEDYLIKYCHQRNGSRSRDAEIYEDELGDAPHVRARDEWMNDGQPIPIRNDRDFFEIQKKVWGKVKHHIHCCYSVEELIKEGYGNEVRL